MALDPSANRQLVTGEREALVATSWGGASLAIGATISTIGIILYATAYGRPAPTGLDGAITVADHAAYILAHWELARRIWLMEMAGELLTALAGFLLPQRRLAVSPLPSAVAWLAVGIGSTVLAAMHAFMIGSYRAAAVAYAQEPAVFTALQGGVTTWFYAGTAVSLIGLMAAFVVEAFVRDRVIPRWTAILGIIGAGAAAIHTIATLALTVGFPALLRGAFTFVLAFGSVSLTFPLAAVLGVAICNAARRHLKVTAP